MVAKPPHSVNPPRRRAIAARSPAIARASSLASTATAALAAVLALAAAIAALGCAGASGGADSAGVASSGVASSGPAAASPAPTANGAPALDAVDADADVPVASATPTAAERAVARFIDDGWATDFSRRTVPLDEILDGGPGKDGIPAIDAPVFEDAAAADDWLAGNDPVQLVSIGGEVKAYPLGILIWHEIVNDTVGGTPVAVTYCPLCNSAIAFDRRLDGRTLDFGVTGVLRHSDLIMYDRQTETWWQQFTGEGIVGEHAGASLTLLPSMLVAWDTVKEAHPEALVLSRDTGYRRQYGRNPYVLYDRQTPFLFRGKADVRLGALERVAAVTLGGASTAYPLSTLAAERVVHDEVGGEPVVVFFAPGAASALDDERVALGRDVGAVGVYRPQAGGMALTFQLDGDHFVDAETGTRWNLLGQAVSGPLQGEQLPPVVHGAHFWFAWAVFRPETVVWMGE